MLPGSLSKMYFIFMLLAIFNVAVTKPSREIVKVPPAIVTRLEPIIKKCEAETNPPADAFKKAMRGIIEDEVSLKFAYCFAFTAGHITEGGHLNINKIISVVKEGETKDKLNKYLEECNKANGEDKMEILRKVAACYEKNPLVEFVI